MRKIVLLFTIALLMAIDVMSRSRQQNESQYLYSEVTSVVVRVKVANDTIIYGNEIDGWFPEGKSIDSLIRKLPGVVIDGNGDITLKGLDGKVSVIIFNGREIYNVNDTTNHREGFLTENVYHRCVDLGLSVNWATCNIGADKPEDFGDYFAWGETSPYYESLDPLVWKEGKEYGYDVNSSTDNYNNRKAVFGTKQPAPASTSAKYSIETEAKKQLDPEDDAAHVNWGGNWRMPTLEECQELVDNCIWEATTRNGVKGYEVKSKTNGNSIFIPAAGCFVGATNTPTIIFDSDDNNKDSGKTLYTGCYWSSTLSQNYSYRASYIFFHINIMYCSHVVDIQERGYGCSIRPVYK